MRRVFSNYQSAKDYLLCISNSIKESIMIVESEYGPHYDRKNEYTLIPRSKMMNPFSTNVVGKLDYLPEVLNREIINKAVFVDAR